MVRNGYLLVWSALVIMVITVSCAKDKAIAPEPPFEGFIPPVEFPVPVYNPDQPITEATFSLGRQLFFDPILSIDSTVACSNCHSQVHAFADHNVKLSSGVNGQLGRRNSPPLFNLAWHPNFMWDGGINHIEVMPIAPITDPTEMGETMANVVQKLRGSEHYQQQFATAFGDSTINSKRLLVSLAHYMAMLISANSKYDKVQAGTATFDADEARGYQLFQQHCNSCHTAPMMTNYTFSNNGIAPTPNDPGRQLITADQADRYQYRIPSLRNIALTYPYMHDGRFFSLYAVLDHYASPIPDSTYTAQPLRGGIPLSSTDKDDLLAFLETLTDVAFISDFTLGEP